MEIILSIFSRIAIYLGPYTRGVQIMSFNRLMKYFKKLKKRTRSNLKRYESEKSILNYVVNQRKKKEIMWSNVKSSRKKESKDFYEKDKSVLAKNNSTPTNSTPALSRTSSLNNTTQIIVATQKFDDDQTLSISWTNITKTNMK